MSRSNLPLRRKRISQTQQHRKRDPYAQKTRRKTHTLLTVSCIAHNNDIIWEGLDQILLTMRPLSDKEIKAYVLKDMPLQSCGAYCYEKEGKTLFTHVTHPTESIQGLPLKQLLKKLLKHN